MPSRLLHLHLQCFCIFYPAALRKSLFQVRDRGQRRVSFAQLVFRVSFPIECGIRLSSVLLRKLAEFLGRAVIAVFVERLAPFAVEVIEPFQTILLAVALLLFPVARLLFAVAFFLLPIAGFLLVAGAAIAAAAVVPLATPAAQINQDAATTAPTAVASPSTNNDQNAKGSTADTVARSAAVSDVVHPRSRFLRFEESG